ncbi:MAG: hypothetical protein HYT22_00455 [Candidatus Niyogibacteria bacterium]|nr:hypothetical protein [Candidatus Niyogibacteria bacterium]
MKYAFGIFAVLFATLAAPAFAEEELDFQKFIGTPTTGGVACVSKEDAQEFAKAILVTRRDEKTEKEMEAAVDIIASKFTFHKCRGGKQYVPKWVVERLDYNLMILEAMGGEDFIVTVWVIATPAALKPLIKEEEAHEVEPPGAIVPPDPAKPPNEIPQGAWQ